MYGVKPCKNAGIWPELSRGNPTKLELFRESFPIYHRDPMKPNFVQLVMKTAINVDLMSSLDGYLKTGYGKSAIKTTSNRNRYAGVTQFLVL